MRGHSVGQISRLRRRFADERLPGLRARQTHDYHRNGLTSLYTALEVLPGRSLGSAVPPTSAPTSFRFLRILARRARWHARHIILDNSSTHKTPDVPAWPANHSRVPASPG